MAPEVEAADKRLFVVPLQPVWNSADANLLLKVGKNLVTLIEEAGPWKVVFYDETENHCERCRITKLDYTKNGSRRWSTPKRYCV